MESDDAKLEKGVSRNQVIEELAGFTGSDVNWKTGKVLKGLYNPDHVFNMG